MVQGCCVTSVGPSLFIVWPSLFFPKLNKRQEDANPRSWGFLLPSIEPQPVLWKEVEGMSVFCVCVHINSSVYQAYVPGTVLNVDSHKNLAGAAAWKPRPQTPHLLRGRAEIWFSLCSLPAVLKKRCCRGCFSLVFFKSTCLFFLYFPMRIKRSRGHNIYCIFPCTPFQGEVLYHLYLSTFMPNHILFHS